MGRGIQVIYWIGPASAGGRYKLASFTVLFVKRRLTFLLPRLSNAGLTSYFLAIFNSMWLAQVLSQRRKEKTDFCEKVFFKASFFSPTFLKQKGFSQRTLAQKAVSIQLFKRGFPCSP